MRWKELFEAPISNIELVPPDHEETWDKGSSFSPTDKKLLQSEKGRAKIIRAFRRTPHTFEVFFFNNWNLVGDSETDNELVDDRAVDHGAGVHDTFEGISGKPGVIRVVQISNLSPLENKMPMTGWTLAHKIGHALQDDVASLNWQGDLAERIKSINRLIINIVSEDTGYTSTSQYYRNAAFNYPSLLASRLTMKSAGNVTSDFEAFAEIIAQYLISGRVKMRLTKPQLSKPFLDTLNKEIADMFDSLEGRVLVEV